MRLYDVRARSAMQTLAQHSVAALCARWTPGSEYGLWTSGMDGDLVVWDVRTSRPQHTLRYARRAGVLEAAAAAGRWHHSCGVTCLEFGADGRTLYTADEGAVMKSWRVADAAHAAQAPLADTGVVFPALAQSRVYADQGLTLDRFAVSTDGTRVYAPTTDGVAAIDTASFVAPQLFPPFSFSLWCHPMSCFPVDSSSCSSPKPCRVSSRASSTTAPTFVVVPTSAAAVLSHLSRLFCFEQQVVSLSDCALVVHDSYARDFDTPDDVLRPDTEPALVSQDSSSSSMLADTAAAAQAAANAQELFGYESVDDGGDGNGEDEVWD